ncbi:MAG: DUF2892 domain-containing protein [Chloroflexales bacterium]
MKNLFNVGMIDRAIRLLLGVFLFMLAFGILGGIGQIIAGVLGTIMLLTGVAGVCPLYWAFDISTNGTDTPATRP